MLELPNPPWIVGHRGAAGEVTENTVPSFLRAVADGADMVELDVQLTADGELAVLHDWDLARMAGIPWKVEETRWADLQTLRLRTGGERGGEGDRVPKLGEVLAALPAGFPLNVELKRRQTARGALCEALLAAIAGRPNLLLSSFDHELLHELRRRAPTAALAPLASEHAADALTAARQMGAVSLHLASRIAEGPVLAAAAAARLPVLAFTVNDAEAARALFRVGVAGVFTDVPGPMRRDLGDSRAREPRLGSI